MLYLSFFLHFVAVDPDDEAVTTLVNHFTQVIDQILADNWSHLPHEWISKKTKQKVYVISPEEANESRTLENGPQPFFLAYHRLGQTFDSYSLLQKYHFKRITPISHVVMGVADSGTNELSPPPKTRKSARGKILM